jgi:curved DNA-binding protein CbpA
MSEFDPYDILGVEPGASAAAVKAAYRLRVRSAHPDRGGNPDEFMTIVRAFDLLSDRDARRMYDESGVVDPDAAIKLRADVTKVLADMFDAAVRSAIDTRLPLDGVDFIDMMTSAVGNNAREAEEQAGRLDSELAELDALRQRIRRRDDHTNVFVDRLDDQIEAKTTEQAALRRRVHVFEIAVIELGNYDSEIELIAAIETEATG